MTCCAPHLSLGLTRSVCPDCLKTIRAERVAIGDVVYLKKTCPDHGETLTPIWRGAQSYLEWGRNPARTSQPIHCATEVAKGCPHDCGLCPDHRQQSCCVLLEITSRCDIACPVCFASARRHGKDATLPEIDGWLDALLKGGGRVHIQLSGGEPTVRDDLPGIIRHIRGRGFDFVQLNTNGVRLAQDPAYLEAIAEAGLDCVFLQFDGVTDEVYRTIRGARLMRLKEQMIENCRRVGVGVVLTPTLVPGVNTDQIGAILDFARERIPTVRAVHFQPVSYFGRTPAKGAQAPRITLPEVMRAIVAHSGGSVTMADFRPGSAENPYCSFSARFTIASDGRMTAIRDARPSCCGVDPAPHAAQHIAVQQGECAPPAPSLDVARERRYVAGQWSGTGVGTAPGNKTDGLDAFDAFLASRERTLGISGMAFQDAWTFDVERVRQCHIHIMAPDNRVIPFCAYNLTDSTGRSLYRPES